MKLPLLFSIIEEMFVPHSSLRSIWDIIGARLSLFNVGKILIGLNLTHNFGFTIGGVTLILLLNHQIFKKKMPYLYQMTPWIFLHQQWIDNSCLKVSQFLLVMLHLWTLHNQALIMSYKLMKNLHIPFHHLKPNRRITRRYFY